MTVSSTSRPVNQPHSSSSSSSSSSSHPRRSRTSHGVVSRTTANYGPFPPPPGPTALNRYGAPGPYGNMATYASYPTGYPRYAGGNIFGSGGVGPPPPPPAGFGGLYGPYNNNNNNNLLGLGGGPYQPDPNDPNSLTNSLGHSTRATFQIIESIVSAVGGFAQMLESTYMATHTSFFGESCRSYTIVSPVILIPPSLLSSSSHYLSLCCSLSLFLSLSLSVSLSLPLSLSLFLSLSVLFSLSLSLCVCVCSIIS